MTGLVVLAAVFALYALVAARLDRWSITAPMVFVLAGAILGPSGTDLLPVSVDSHTTLAITELTLALLLFSDAATVRLREVEGDARLPSRLLFVGLPLTVLLGALLAHAVEPSLTWAAAALVATILAPTDAALGLAVVTNRLVPARIRRALNVESGLNDGIATPFVTLFLAAVVSEEASGGRSWGHDGLIELALAVVVAVAVGGGGGYLLGRARGRGWTSDVSEQLGVLALAVLAYEGAVEIGGNGFVAAFAGGLFFGAVTKSALAQPIAFTETIGMVSSFLVWTIFGALFVGAVVTASPSWAAIGYALLSLTVVRMLPVAIALAGCGLRASTLLFMGWFGPRGLASVVFTLIAVDEFDAHGVDAAPLVQVATWTILLSVLAHGVTAAPLAARYGSAIGAFSGIPEREPAREPTPRIRDVALRRRQEPAVSPAGR